MDLLIVGKQKAPINNGRLSPERDSQFWIDQGGVLSSLLWSLVVDELMRLLTEVEYHAIGYADDIL